MISEYEFRIMEWICVCMSVIIRGNNYMFTNRVASYVSTFMNKLNIHTDGISFLTSIQMYAMHTKWLFLLSINMVPCKSRWIALHSNNYYTILFNTLPHSTSARLYEFMAVETMMIKASWRIAAQPLSYYSEIVQFYSLAFTGLQSHFVMIFRIFPAYRIECSYMEACVRSKQIKEIGPHFCQCNSDYTNQCKQITTILHLFHTIWLHLTGIASG